MKTQMQMVQDAIDRLESMSSEEFRESLIAAPLVDTSSIPNSHIKRAYINIALITEQFINPVPTIESNVEGNQEEFSAAVSATNRLLGVE